MENDDAAANFISSYFHPVFLWSLKKKSFVSFRRPSYFSHVDDRERNRPIDLGKLPGTSQVLGTIPTKALDTF